MRLRDKANLATRQTDGTWGRRSASWHFCGFTLAATSGPCWSARNFPCWPALDDWFTATNLISALARPGHNRPLVIRSEFLPPARLG